MAPATRGANGTARSNGRYEVVLIEGERSDAGDGFDGTRARRSSSVESALSLVGDDLVHVHSSGMTAGGCCRGYSARLLYLMGCAVIEYIAHTVVLVLGPMIALHFYPSTSYPRLGFYTAILSGAGYLGSTLSCKMWINIARSLKSLFSGVLPVALIEIDNICGCVWRMDWIYPSTR